MRTKEEISKLKNLIGDEVDIYYVVRGRKLETGSGEENEFFEKIFFNENWIMAREAAFSFYKNYVYLLEENRLLFQTISSNSFDSLEGVFEEHNFQKYSTNYINFQNPELFHKGVTLNMVVGKPISYMGKTDKKGDNYLIHGVFNFEESDIKNLIDGLVREYGYYTKHKQNSGNYVELIDFSAYKNYGVLKNSILSIPFNWDFNPFVLKQKEIQHTNKRNEKYKIQIKNGSLDINAFETKLNDNKLLKIIASFLNTKGGNLFYGITETRITKDVFKNTKIEEFRKETEYLIKQKFPDAANYFILKFIKVNSITVAVFTVSAMVQNPVFVTENKSKKFYVRDQNGIKLLNDSEEVCKYCLWRKPISNFAYQHIIDLL